MRDKPKSDSLEAMGLQAFMDSRYYQYGGYIGLVKRFEAGESNAEIGRAYGGKERHTVRIWRSKWQQEARDE